SNLDDLEHLVTLWQAHLRSRNRSPRTIATYADSADRLGRYLRREGRSQDMKLVDRKVIEGFIADQLAVHAPATAALRFRSLQQFFRWATEERILPLNPMERMKPPKVPEVPVAVVPDEALRKLLATCDPKLSPRGP